jgi:hypothetical protein
MEIPNDWDPRWYQFPLWRFMSAGGSAMHKRACEVAHRRWGKDDLAMNFIAHESFNRTGTYWHMLPAATQARKVVWDSINRRGQRRIDQAFPHAIRKGSANSSEMKIPLVNDSIYQCVGSDYFENLLGANPVGIVFSEWQRANPAAWDYLRPILRENGGWAVWIFTPFGRNHGKTTYDTFTRLQAEGNPNYYSELSSIRDTGQLTDADIEEERNEGMSEGMIRQEYYCDFTAPTEGAYYSKELAALEAAGHIGDYAHDPSLPTHTSWDIGYGDSTAVWWWQLIPLSNIIHVIDYYQAEGEGLPHYARVIQQRALDRGYIYGEHIAPHDIESGEWTVGESRLRRAKAFGLNFIVNPRVQHKDETIECVRSTLPLCRFDKTRCQVGLDSLWTYHKKYNEKLRAWSDNPEHDWASDGADAFGEGAKRFAWLRRRMHKPKPRGEGRAGDWMAT